MVWPYDERSPGCSGGVCRDFGSGPRPHIRCVRNVVSRINAAAGGQFPRYCKDHTFVRSGVGAELISSDSTRAVRRPNALLSDCRSRGKAHGRSVMSRSTLRRGDGNTRLIYRRSQVGSANEQESDGTCMTASNDHIGCRRASRTGYVMS